MEVWKDSCFCISMLKCLLFVNYKKQYLFKKFDFFDMRSFFFLGIGLDGLAWWDAQTSTRNVFRELGQLLYFKLWFGKFARQTKSTFNIGYEKNFFQNYEGFVREKMFWKNIKNFFRAQLVLFYAWVWRVHKPCPLSITNLLVA